MALGAPPALGIDSGWSLSPGVSEIKADSASLWESFHLQHPLVAGCRGIRIRKRGGMLGLDPGGCRPATGEGVPAVQIACATPSTSGFLSWIFPWSILGVPKASPPSGDALDRL